MAGQSPYLNLIRSLWQDLKYDIQGVFFQSHLNWAILQKKNESKLNYLVGQSWLITATHNL